MTVMPTVLVLMKCPQCCRLLHLNPPEHIDEDGDTYVEAEPIHRALGMHLSYGCAAGRRG